MTTLSLLKPARSAKNLTTRNLADITGISFDRVKELETSTASKRAEPWLDEAVLLSRALCTDGVTPLISADRLCDLDLGPAVVDEHAALHAGIRLPLSSACRLALRYGLPDPALLIPDTLHRQAWAILHASERNPHAIGWCPWCAADIGSGEAHGALCLPHNLFHRDPSLAGAVDGRPGPVKPGEKRAASGLGHGLRRLRDAKEATQKDFAAIIDVAPNHYARIERCVAPLTTHRAEIIAEHFGVDVAEIYRRDVPGEGESA